MIRKVALLFSIIFHPLFLFFYLLLYLVYYTDLFLLYRYAPNIWIFFLYVFANTIAIPLVLIFFYSRDLMLIKKENRTIPYLIMIVVYGFMLFFLIKFYISAYVLRLVFAMIVGLICLTIINKFYKSSLHTFAMGILLAFFIKLYFLDSGYFYYPLIVMLLIAGIVGSARLALEAHSRNEIFSGYGIGFITSIIILNI